MCSNRNFVFRAANQEVHYSDDYLHISNNSIPVSGDAIMVSREQFCVGQSVMLEAQ